MKTLTLFLVAWFLAVTGVQSVAQTTVSITAPDAAAGEKLAGQTANPGIIRVARTGSTAGALTVFLKSISGTAVGGTDYEFGIPLTTFVAIPAGSSSVDLVVNVIDDWLTEGNETVRIDLDTETPAGNPLPYTISGGGRATVTIADNEDPLAAPRAIVTVAAVDAFATETAGGTDPAVFRITRTNNLTPALNILYTLGGTATSGVDFAALPATITIPAGVASVDVTIAPIDDLAVEDAVELIFTVQPTDVVGSPSPAEAYVLGPAITASATIVSEDLPPPTTVAITTPGSGASVVQNDPLTVNFTAAAVDGYIVGYTVFAGSAAVASGTTNLPASTPAGTPFSGTASITFPGTATPQSITVRVTNNLGTTGTSAAIPVTVIALPLPTVAITAPGNYAIAAATQPVTVTFTASAVDGYIVSYQILGGTGGSGTTGLPASTPAGTPFNGTTSVIFNSISTTFNYTQPLAIRVTNNHGISTTSAYIGIVVGPNVPIINIYALDAQGAEVSAGAANIASFRVTHSHPASATVGFLFAIGGTAREGVDYTLSSAGTFSSGLFGNWFTFPPGTTEAVIEVHPVDDLFIESSESVSLSLHTPPFIGFNEGGPNGFEPGTFGFLYGPNSTASVSILDNDTTPPPFPVIIITAADPVGAETTDDSNPAVFTITRTSGPTDVPLTVNYLLISLPPPWPYVYPIPPMATNGVDFPRLPGAVTIPAGATSVDIVILPTNDLIKEPVENVRILLGPSAVAWPGAGGYVLDEQTVATITIQDLPLAPGTPTISIRTIDSQAIEEINAPSRWATLRVQSNIVLAAPVTVNYSISGTAINGVDYATLPGTITIPAGSTGASITVTPIADGIAEPTESVGVTIQPPPVTANPPPYVVASDSPTTKRTAGVSIRDIYRLPSAFYTRRQQLIQRLQNRHVVIARPLPTPEAAPVVGPAQSYAVEASTNFVDWVEIGTAESANDSEEFVDVEAADYEARFYRFRPIPPATP